jgi:hypothetical protein
LGDGTVRGVGCLQTSWRFNFITLTQLATLRAYCSGSSAQVYIQTLARDGVYKIYSALMVWTETEQPKADMLVDFVVKFRNMVEVP